MKTQELLSLVQSVYDAAQAKELAARKFKEESEKLASHKQKEATVEAYKKAMEKLKESQSMAQYSAEKLHLPGGLVLTRKPGRVSISQTQVAGFFDLIQVNDFFATIRPNVCEEWSVKKTSS